jgi:hypothetical protein
MQTIYLDISNKGVIPCIQAKQSEVGRKFLAVITDNGVPYNIASDSLLSVWYEGDTDAGNYSSIDSVSAFSIDGNKVAVELVAQMLFKPGNGELCLSITHGDGGETNTWNIPYCVEYKPGAGSSVPTEYYTALTEAGAVAAKYAGEAKEAAESISTLFIESEEHPGCYYRVVNGVREWVNPPMIIDVEYRTTQRSNGNVVFVKKTEKMVSVNATTWNNIVESSGTLIGADFMYNGSPAPYYRDADLYTCPVFSEKNLNFWVDNAHTGGTLTITMQYTKNNEVIAE